MKKTILGVIICFALSCLIAFGLPFLASDVNAIEDNHESKSILKQEVLRYSEKKNTYHKLYYRGQLVGLITDLDAFYGYISDEYSLYEDQFPNTTLGLTDDLYITVEDSYNEVENIDKEIVDYLTEKSLLGIKTNAIEFSTQEGVFDIIYVNDLDDFYEARNQFLLNFVSEDTLATLSNNQAIGDPTDFGTIETGLKIQETMSFQEAFTSPANIFTSVNEIYTYLCYGRNTEREYYETVEGDTLRGVGYRFQNMSPKQIMMLNPDVLFNEEQVLTPGTVLNVTYFSSPLTIVVTKERLAQETVVPENPEYRSDANLAEGVVRIDVEEENGLKNVLYEETWVNGVLQSGSEKSSATVREPIRAVISVGTLRPIDYGSGNYIWPVDNPAITCGWGCYYGHTGTDIVNRYQAYGAIYAMDTGVVEIASYHYINGLYVVINHQNGVKTYYGHMSAMYVNVGDIVQRGDVIGQIGMTGLATGPHVHSHFIIDGLISNTCNFLDCGSVIWS